MLILQPRCQKQRRDGDDLRRHHRHPHTLSHHDATGPSDLLFRLPILPSILGRRLLSGRSRLREHVMPAPVHGRATSAADERHHGDGHEHPRRPVHHDGGTGRRNASDGARPHRHHHHQHPRPARRGLPDRLLHVRGLLPRRLLSRGPRMRLHVVPGAREQHHHVQRPRRRHRAAERGRGSPERNHDGASSSSSSFGDTEAHHHDRRAEHRTPGASVAAGQNSCANGWYACGDANGGGCCPSGYACAASCVATDGSPARARIPVNLASRRSSVGIGLLSGLVLAQLLGLGILGL